VGPNVWTDAPVDNLKWNTGWKSFASDLRFLCNRSTFSVLEELCIGSKRTIYPFMSRGHVLAWCESYMPMALRLLESYNRYEDQSSYCRFGASIRTRTTELWRRWSFSTTTACPSARRFTTIGVGTAVSDPPSLVKLERPCLSDHASHEIKSWKDTGLFSRRTP
jgi:hypothetical protein